MFEPDGAGMDDLGNITGKKVKIINIPSIHKEGIITASEEVE